MTTSRRPRSYRADPEALATALLAVLRANPELVTWLTEELA